MSWIVDTIAQALDSADCVAADVASSHGYLPASYLEPTGFTGQSLVPTTARDKVKRRIEAQRHVVGAQHSSDDVTPPASPQLRPMPSWAIPSPSKDLTLQLQQLRQDLQDMTDEAAENLAGMNEAERAREESEQVALELQRKSVVFMERCNSLTSQNDALRLSSEDDLGSSHIQISHQTEARPNDADDQQLLLEALQAERRTSAEMREGMARQERDFEDQLCSLRSELREKSIELYHQVAGNLCEGGMDARTESVLTNTQQQLDEELARAAELELKLSLNACKVTELELRLRAALEENTKLQHV